MPDKSEEIKMYYAHINNMGDALNSLILEKLFERRAAPSCHIFDFDIMGIGSCLDLLITGKNVSVERQKLLSRVSDTFSMKGYIWGTGFLFKYDFKQTMLMRRNLEFVLVRGEYTRRAVSQICGREIDVPLADGGLLAPLLIADQKIEKKHDVGIIPHFQEKKHPAVGLLRDALAGRYDTCVIDVQSNPLDVIRHIAECRYIVSSSLHGLIAADAFGIPNTRIEISRAPLGAGFKIDDYYSGYGIEKAPVNIANGKAIDIPRLFDAVQPEAQMVKTKKEQLIRGMKQIISSLG